MTITDLELEQIAEADKKAQRKANTLGADRSLSEEPFGNSSIVLKEDVFAVTPNINDRFSSPEYKDVFDGYGLVATRYTKARLHPLITSGQTGPNSIQTFLIVNDVPASDNPADIERVRIKRLVPPDLSIGKTNAADPDPNFRGFELALYPGYSNGIYVDAYDGYGEIPVSADPSAELGIGSSARWTVDYANGIVRLSAPPISGVGSVFNPFGVFAKIDGVEDSSPCGRLQLFATFYRYTGPNLTVAGGTDLVTVGDGIDSYGSFYGTTSTVMQEAVDSLWPRGGTIFVNSGNYSYADTVVVPRNINIVGLSHNAKIYSQSGNTIFRFVGLDLGIDSATDLSNCSIRGLQLFPDGSGAAVEFASTSNNALIQNASIKDNIIWTNATSVGIAFAPDHSDVLYKDCEISGNTFKTTGPTTTYIGQISGGSSSIDGLVITNNNFSGTSSTSSAIDLSSGSITTAILDLYIINNSFDKSLNINLNNSAAINSFVYDNNSEAKTLSVYALNNANLEGSNFNTGFTLASGANNLIIDDCDLNNATIDGYVQRSLITNSYFGRFELSHSANNFKFTNNTCRDNTYFTAKELDAFDVNLDNIIIANNKFNSGLHISNSSTATGEIKIQDLVIHNNLIMGEATFARGVEDGPTSILFDRLRFAENTVIDGYSVLFGNTNAEDGAPRTDVVFKSLSVINNVVSGNIGFYDTVDFTSDYSSIISGNILDGSGKIFITSTDTSNVTISNNRAARIILFGETDANTTLIGSGTARNIIISGNYLYGTVSVTAEIAFAPVSATPLVFDNIGVINNNLSGSSATIKILNSSTVADDYRITYLNVAGNKLVDSSSSIVVGPSVTLAPGGSGQLFNDSNVTSNDVEGTLTIGGISVNRLNVSGNKTSGAVTLSKALNTCTVTDNIFLDITFSETFTNSVFGNNNIHGTAATFTGALTGSTIVGNNVNGNMTTGSLNGCNFNDNKVLGALTTSNANTSSFDGNVILSWISTDWTNSTFSGNSIDDTFVLNDITTSAFSDSKIVSNMTINSVSYSSLSGLMVAGGTGLSIASTFAHSTASNNSITIGFSIGGATTTSTLNANKIGTLTLTGAISNSTISDNAATIGGAVFGSSVTSSTVVGNSFQALTAGIGFSCGAITDSSISNNLFKSTDAGAGGMSFGAVTTSTISSNTIDQASTSNTTFSTITASTVSGMVVDATAIVCGKLMESVFADAYIDASFAITAADDGALSSSRISNSYFTGLFSLTRSTGAGGAVVSSKLTGNTFANNAQISSSGVCLDDSAIDNNNFAHNLYTYVTAAGGTYMLDNSILTNNIIGSGLIINNNSGSATYAYVASKSIISDNNIGGDCLIGVNTNTSHASLVFDSVTMSNNKFESNVIIGADARTQSLTTYRNFIMTGNAIGLFGAVDGELRVSGALSGSTISNNIINNNANFDLLSSCVVSDNIFSPSGTGTVLLSYGMINGTIFNDNIVAGYLTISGSISTATFSNNNIIQATIVNDATSDFLISNNKFVSTLIFYGTFTNNRFISNSNTGTLTMSGNISSSIISGNSGNTLNLSASTISDLIISNNKFTVGSINGPSNRQDITISNNILSSLDLTSAAGTISDIIIESNNVSGTVVIGTNISSSVICDNILGSTFGTGAYTLTDCAIDGNYVVGAVTLGALSDCIIADNSFSSSVSLGSTSTNVRIIGNHVQTTFVMTGNLADVTAIGNVILSNATISGQIIDSTFTTNDFGGSVTLPTSSISNFVFSSNIVNSAIIAGAAAVSFSNCVIDGNTIGSISIECGFTDSSISNNNILGSATIDTNVATGTLIESTVNNNKIDGTLSILNDSSLTARALTKSRVGSNFVGGSITISASTVSVGAMYLSKLDSNSVIGDITISVNSAGSLDAIDRSIISNNDAVNLTVNSAAGQDGLYDSVLSNNNIQTNISIHENVTSGLPLNEAIITGNTAVSIKIGSSTRDGDDAANLDSIVDGNTCGLLSIFGQLSGCSVINNNVNDGTNGDFILGALSYTKVSGNTINCNGTLRTVSIGYNAATSPVITNSVISDNVFSGSGSLDMNQGSITNSVIVNNKVTYTLDSLSMTNVNIANNYFNAFNTEAWSDVTCSGNTFTGAFSLSATSSPVSDVAFQANSCQSTVAFSKPSAGGTNDFVRGTFTGNIFSGAVSFGTDTYSNEMVRMVFNSNSGAGSVTFYTGPTSMMDNCMIIGNSMSGALTIDDNAAGTYPSPPTTSNQPMIALNWFGSYSGISFSDINAIGWGDNFGSLMAPTVIGSNLI